MKILSRRFYAEILALQGFPAGLRDSYFIRDKSGYPEFRNNQTFSIAGSRKGFGDPRGTLFFELARLAEARKPPYHEHGYGIQNIKRVIRKYNGTYLVKKEDVYKLMISFPLDVGNVKI